MQQKTCDMSSVATEEMSSVATEDMSSVATEYGVDLFTENGSDFCSAQAASGCFLLPKNNPSSLKARSAVPRLPPAFFFAKKHPFFT